MAGLYLERGLAHEGKGDHERAIADFNEAIRRDGSLVSAYFGRAMAYEATGERDRAGADIDAAIRLDRNLVAALYIQRGDDGESGPRLRQGHRGFRKGDRAQSAMADRIFRPRRILRGHAATSSGPSPTTARS